VKVGLCAALALAACFAVRAALEREAVGSRVHTLVEARNGDISDAQLTALMADAGPGALHIASSHDPDLLPDLGRPLGWKRLEANTPPRLWLGRLSMEEAERINGVLPDSAAANPPADPFVLRASASEKAAAVQCMTAAIYYEAALEPRVGQEAVAQVVLNRMRHPGYPKSVCGVVFQGSDRPGCQFSFACDGSMSRQPVQWAWRNAHDVAEQALDGFVMNKVGTSTHYHTSWVMASWTPTLLKVGQIGAHIFFRPLGPEGDPADFRARYGGGEALASKVDLIGKPLIATTALPKLVQASAAGGVLVPKSLLRDGRPMVLPDSVVILTHLKTQEAAKTLAVPPMHALVAMRAAAARAALGTSPTEDVARAASDAEAAVQTPRSAPLPLKTVSRPDGFQTVAPPASGG
jgi:spore germination cell wall hydrolase CwlJ-like protein